MVESDFVDFNPTFKYDHQLFIIGLRCLYVCYKMFMYRNDFIFTTNNNILICLSLFNVLVNVAFFSKKIFSFSRFKSLNIGIGNLGFKFFVFNYVQVAFLSFLNNKFTSDITVISSVVFSLLVNYIFQYNTLRFNFENLNVDRDYVYKFFSSILNVKKPQKLTCERIYENILMILTSVVFGIFSIIMWYLFSSNKIVITILIPILLFCLSLILKKTVKDETCYCVMTENRKNGTLVFDFLKLFSELGYTVNDVNNLYAEMCKIQKRQDELNIKYIEITKDYISEESKKSLIEFSNRQSEAEKVIEELSCVFTNDLTEQVTRANSTFDYILYILKYEIIENISRYHPDTKISSIIIFDEDLKTLILC